MPLKKAKNGLLSKGDGYLKGLGQMHTASNQTRSCPIALIALTDERCASAHGSLVAGFSMDGSLKSARNPSSFTMTGLGHWGLLTDDPYFSRGGVELMTLTPGLGNDHV